MTDEQREINRRVAVAIGWRWVRLTKRNVWSRTMRVMVPELVLTGVSPLADGNAVIRKEIPDFCNDPAAADLVRQEIEHQGLDLLQYSEIQGGKRVYQSYIRGNPDQYIGAGDSADSPHMALCLAFLAACEAQEKEGGEG